MDYHPDTWVIVKLSGAKVEDRYYRILAGWAGGYMHGDSWKMSSGIESIEETETHWVMPNTSGSVYHCHKEMERLSMYTSNILASFVEQNTEDVAVERVEMKDILGEFKRSDK